MLISHLTQLADIYKVSRNVESRHKEEIKTLLFSGVKTRMFHSKPRYVSNQSTISEISKKQFVFLFDENLAEKGNYIFFGEKFYKIDGTERLEMYSGSVQFRAICDEIE